MMGVVPGSLSAEDGVEIATHCKSTLSAHDIDDVHVEIRESVVICSASPGPPTTSNATVRPECLSSSPLPLSLPICAKVTPPSIEGTGGFFISDPLNPAKIYVVPPQPRKNVLLFGDVAFEKHIIIKQLESRLKDVEQMDERTPRRSRIRSSPVGGGEEADRSPREIAHGRLQRQRLEQVGGPYPPTGGDSMTWNTPTSFYLPHRSQHRGGRAHGGLGGD
ncbi:hypothetical protein BGW80DRAFT_1254817 [Lactifluus volemus]|nr:hypothetical protein BGW80DRAFT_1254817 [Lactifluus volemus]